MREVTTHSEAGFPSQYNGWTIYRWSGYKENPNDSQSATLDSHWIAMRVPEIDYRWNYCYARASVPTTASEESRRIEKLEAFVRLLCVIDKNQDNVGPAPSKMVEVDGVLTEVEA